MPDDKYSPPRQTTADTGHAIARATAQLVPVVGSAAVELLNHVVMPPLERRRDDWMATVAAALRSHDVRLEDIGERQELLDTFLQASASAIRTSSEEKRAALRNAVVNAALANEDADTDAARRQVMLRLVDDFGVWHLRILDLFNDPINWFGGRAIELPRRDPRGHPPLNWVDLIDVAFPPMKSQLELLAIITNDLARAKLIEADPLRSGSSVAPYRKLTTNFGETFVSFVRAPATTA
jgi:hypothetical protein